MCMAAGQSGPITADFRNGTPAHSFFHYSLPQQNPTRRQGNKLDQRTSTALGAGGGTAGTDYSLEKLGGNKQTVLGG